MVARIPTRPFFFDFKSKKKGLEMSSENSNGTILLRWYRGFTVFVTLFSVSDGDVTGMDSSVGGHGASLPVPKVTVSYIAHYRSGYPPSTVGWNWSGFPFWQTPQTAATAPASRYRYLGY